MNTWRNTGRFNGYIMDFSVTYLMIINYFCIVSNCWITHIAGNYSVVKSEVQIGSQYSIDQFYSQTAWSELTGSGCHVSVFPVRVYFKQSKTVTRQDS